MNIRPVDQVRIPELAPKAPAAGSSGDFLSAFGSALESVNSLDRKAEVSVERFLNGEDQELHRVAMDQQRAEIALDLLLQVRNKVVQAYQEVMRMPL
jgi:flagellar hook-basal body complex protein FliE